MTEIKEQIKALQSKLTGNLLEDCEIQAEIYELKKELAKLSGITIEQYVEDDREECEYCSG